MNILPTASSTLTAALADISAVAQPTLNSVYAWVLIGVGVPFAFYVVHKLFGLIPGRSGRRSY